MNRSAERDNKETLDLLQRWLEIVLMVAMLLLFAFLAYHQLANTGFYTAKFGTLEMVCLYGPILLAVTAPLVRAVSGRRNPARPLEVAANLFLAVGSLWLLNVFPFDFTHLADALPGPSRSLFGWVTNDVGKILLILQVIVGPTSAIFTTVKYLSVRRRETVALY
jgi:hypothetical protein